MSVKVKRTLRGYLNPGRVVTGLLNLTVLAAVSVLLVGHGPVAGELASQAAVEPTFRMEGLPHLEYTLTGGYVHNWLVAGPQAIPLDPDRFAKGNSRRQVARHTYQEGSGITQLPVENGSLNLDDSELTWHYYRTLDDHFVDLSAAYPGYHSLRAWAYAQVAFPSPQRVTLILTTHGPADLWLNGRHVHRQEHFRDLDPKSVSFQAEFEQGHNQILVRFEQVAAGKCPYAMALQIASPILPGGLPVLLPTTVESVVRRRMFERLFEQVHLEHEVDRRGNNILLHWAEDLAAQSAYTVQIQDLQNRIYVEALPVSRPSATVNAGHPARLWAGDYRVVLKPPLAEWYDRNLRYQRDIPIHVVDNAYSEHPYGTYSERRREALEDAARREGGLYSEIAKLELGRWAEFEAERVLETVAQIDQDHSDAHMVGLLGMLYRYADDARFDPVLTRRLTEWALGSTYWLGGQDTIAYRDPPVRENVLFYTSQILAGQLWPVRPKVRSGQPSRALRKEGERRALSWLYRQATAGLDEWHSDCSCEQYAVALSHLADLAENDEVRELATAVLDRMLLTMALNSYRGVYGSAHGRTRAPMIKDGRLNPTSGVSRLMWGMGIYNHHLAGTVSLASSTYELPPAIAACAADCPEEMWIRKHHTGGAPGWRAWFASGSEVDIVTYKTPDYMLSSAQDYRAGERGQGEQIWQATLGPDAVVLSTHPANMSESDAHRNDFWRGNAVLPRVAQWKDALIAVHKLPQDDWMGFTHAYFPVYAFDEYVLQEDAGGHPWAFARKGDGYLGLTAAQGIELIRKDPGAYRELRSYGENNVWLCLMGRAATDGSFEEFQRAVLALEVDFREAAVSLRTLRGDTLSFGWTGPLRIDGDVQPIRKFEPYQLPDCILESSAVELPRWESAVPGVC